MMISRWTLVALDLLSVYSSVHVRHNLREYYLSMVRKHFNFSSAINSLTATWCIILNLEMIKTDTPFPLSFQKIEMLLLL